jgi:exosortase A
MADRPGTGERAMSTVAEPRAAAIPAAILDSWKLHLAVLGALVLVLGALFFPDIRSAAIVWYHYPAYSHCFLIIPISAWLVWERRDALLNDTPVPMPLALLAAIPFVMLWFAGRFASITEFRQFAIVGIAEVLILAVLGWNIFRKIAFPALYLFFLVPTGQYLIPPLQDITAKFVQLGLDLFGITYYQDGLIFELVNGRYEIAEACAGLRFLVATVALGVLFAHLMYRRWIKIAIFMVSCVVFPIVGNGIRALVTVMVANYTNNEVAAGFDHIVYGWAFAVAIIFILMFVGARYRDPEADLPLPAGGIHPVRPALLAATVLGALVLLSAGPAAAWMSDRQPSYASQDMLDKVAAAPGWEKSEATGEWGTFFVPGAARTIASLTRPGDPASVDLDFWYYVRDRNTASLLAAHSHPWNDPWHPVGQRNVKSTVNGTEVAFEETQLAAFNQKRLVWSVYWVDGRFTTSSVMVRLLEFRSGITHGNSAILAFSTPITSSTEDARARLAALVAAFPDLSGSLSKAGAPPAQPN